MVASVALVLTLPCILALCHVTLKAAHSNFRLSHVTYWSTDMLANVTSQGLEKHWQDRACSHYFLPSP